MQMCLTCSRLVVLMGRPLIGIQALSIIMAAAAAGMLCLMFIINNLINLLGWMADWCDGASRSDFAFQDALLFALPIGFFQALALVVLLFAFGQADVHFDKAAVVMQIERHDGVARALGFAD